MMVDVFGARQRSRNFTFAAEIFGREPLYAGAALCLAAFSAPTLVAMTLDGRTLAGVNVWLKPLRFEVALTIYLATRGQRECVESHKSGRKHVLRQTFGQTLEQDIMIGCYAWCRNNISNELLIVRPLRRNNNSLIDSWVRP